MHLQNDNQNYKELQALALKKKANLELESYLKAAMNTEHEVVKVNPLCSPTTWPIQTRIHQNMEKLYENVIS